MGDDVLTDAIEEAKILGIFKNLCTDYGDFNGKCKLRNVLANSSSENEAIKSIVKRKYYESFDEEGTYMLVKLVKAFLAKSNYRKPIGTDIKEKLLQSQNHKCAFCDKHIDLGSHADHIVPFKYVGDELEDNFQMLCSNCNEKKKASIDYQIRFLLKLV